MILIPINNEPNQSFTITVPQGDTNLPLAFYISWNAISGYWQMNIRNTQTDTELVSSLPLVGGNAPTQNILKQFEYLGIGPAYVVPLSTATTDWPLLGDWGTNFVFAWGDP